jgi:AraC-like DNA-binding protein
MEQILYDLSGTGIVANRIIRDYEYTMEQKHFHQEYEIYYLMEGERYYFIEKGTYLVKEGSLVFINRGQIHKTATVNKVPHERILLLIDEKPFSDFFALANTLNLGDFFRKHWGVITFDNEEKIKVERILLDIAKELEYKAMSYEFVVMGKLSELLLLVMRKYESSTLPFARPTVSSKKHDIVQDVAGYIAENYDREESLNSIAKRFFLSRSYLSRIFKEITGLTVNEFLNIQRIKASQEYLSTTSLSITEIAGTIGYDSITYFEKVFRKYNACTPLGYRKKYKEGLMKNA